MPDDFDAVRVAHELRLQLESTWRYGPQDPMDPHDGSVEKWVESVLAAALLAARKDLADENATLREQLREAERDRDTYKAVVQDDAEMIGNCETMLAAYDKSDSYVTEQLPDLIRRALQDRDVLKGAMLTIDTMPVDGVSPFVIESMLRQAKSLAYAALSRCKPPSGGEVKS